MLRTRSYLLIRKRNLKHLTFKIRRNFKTRLRQNSFSVGELWLDLPVTAVDASRQLLASYWGTNLKSQLSDQLYAEIGRVEKYHHEMKKILKVFVHGKWNYQRI